MPHATTGPAPGAGKPVLKAAKTDRKTTDLFGEPFGAPFGVFLIFGFGVISHLFGEPSIQS